MSWYRPLLFSPHLDWLQVEISTRCNASCLYCPHTLYASCWQGRFMPLTLFRQLEPVLKKTALVYLQGWGEPLLHPDFEKFARLAKSIGCRVGTTTNGLLLTEDLCRRLVKAGLDVIAFSLAGIDRKNDQIRRGTSLQQVKDSIAMLRRIKQELGVPVPAIHIAYLLLRSRLEDLEDLPAFFVDLGIDQVVISTLDLVASSSLADEALVPDNQAQYAALRQRLDAMRASAGNRGVPVHAWLAQPGQSGDCTENIHNAAVITVNGEVAPCVYASLPLSAEVRHWIDGRAHPLVPLTFGNIGQTSFATIWNSTPYKAFRRAHQSRHFPPSCQDCIRRRMSSGRSQEEPSPLPATTIAFFPPT